MTSKIEALLSQAQAAMEKSRAADEEYQAALQQYPSLEIPLSVGTLDLIVHENGSLCITSGPRTDRRMVVIDLKHVAIVGRFIAKNYGEPSGEGHDEDCLSANALSHAWGLQPPKQKGSAQMSKLYFRYGTMNAGKSLHLLAAANQYTETGRSVQFFVPRDAGTTTIESRVGVSVPAQIVGPAWNRVIRRASTSCVFVDEAQFLAPCEVYSLARFAHDNDIPVLCYGLRTDSNGRLFPGSAALFACADDIQEIKSVCAQCQRKAKYNMRLDSGGKKVLHGPQVETDKKKYLAVCHRCFEEWETT